MDKSILIALAMSITCACSGNLDTFGLGADGGRPPDAGASSVGPTVQVVPADILFVVDNSASVVDEQATLAANFARFVDQVAGAGDYRIGVVSTDMDSFQGERAGHIVITHAQEYPQRLISIDSTDCVQLPTEHGCLRGPDQRTAVLDSRDLNREALISAFQERIQLGGCGSGNERGLEAMLTALQSNGCQSEPFLRPEANLIIIFISDEDDTSNVPVSSYVQEVLRIKPASQVRVAVIGGVWAGQASRCGLGAGPICGSLCEAPLPLGSHQACVPGTQPTQCPDGEYCDAHERHCESIDRQYWRDDTCDWCTYYATADCCSARPSQRYVDFARAMELKVSAADPRFPVAGCVGLGSRVACLVDSICQDSFGDTLARIARELMLTAP